MPLLYHLDADLKPLKDPRSFGLLSGAFLGDPEEIKAAQEKVAAQTKVEDTSVESEEEGKSASSRRRGASMKSVLVYSRVVLDGRGGFLPPALYSACSTASAG